MFEPLHVHVTPRELEIIDCLVGGASARDVADQLQLSFHTVRTHIKNIYDKLGVINRVELVRWRLEIVNPATR